MNERLFNLLLKEYSLSIEDYNFLNSSLSYEKVIHLDRYQSKFSSFKDEILKLKNTKILVFGDFDADGIISTTIIYSLLKSEGFDVSFSIPIKSTHGYGLKPEDVSKNYETYICVDNGVNALDAINKIKNENKNILIIDHHSYTTLPIEEVKVLHPELLQGDHHFSAGYLSYLFYSFYKGKHDDYFFTLGATSLLSDVIDLNNENRFVLRFLDDMLPGKYFPNIFAFSKSNSIKTIDQLSTDFITYLNALTRMDVQDNQVFIDLVNFLSSSEGTIDMNFVAKLKNLNEEKKEIVKTVYDSLPKTDSIYFIEKLKTKEGLTGLIANKVLTTDKKELVAIFSDIGNDQLKGSIRTLGEMELLTILKEDFVVDGGGHEKAVGLTINDKDFDKCKKFLENLKVNSTRKISLEDEIDFKDLDEDYLKTYFSFRPMLNNIPYLKLKLNNVPKSTLTFSKDLKHVIYKVSNLIKIVIFYFGKDQVDALPNENINLECHLNREFYKSFMSYNLNSKILD